MFQRIYDKILKFATLRPRSEKEVNDWLKKHKVHKSLHKELFSRLKRLDLLDDEKFAKWWIEQRTAFRPRGKRALVAELRQKGIDRDLINEIIAGAKIDEENMAKEILKKKAYRWERLEGLEKRKKMSEFLARKGFSWAVIKGAIDDFWEKG